MILIDPCGLRLVKRAQAIDDQLVALEQNITAINTEGIIDGFKSAWLGVNTMSPIVKNTLAYPT